MADEKRIEAAAKATYERERDEFADDPWEVYGGKFWFIEGAKVALEAADALLPSPPFEQVSLELGVCLIDGAKPSQERLFSILSRWLAVGGQYQEEAGERENRASSTQKGNQ